MGIRQLGSSMVSQARNLFRARGSSSTMNHGHGHINVSSRSSSSNGTADDHVPKGHLAVYVGDDDDQSYDYKHRFVVPISYLKQPLFQDLLRRSEEEYGFDHPMGGLTIPCTKNAFLHMAASHFNQPF